MRFALIAMICFMMGGLVGSFLTVQFGSCKNDEIIFQLEKPRKPESSNTLDGVYGQVAQKN